MESRSDDANLLARVRRRFTWNGHGGATGQPDKTMTVGVGRPGLGRVLPLSALQLGQGGQIGYIQTSRPQHIQKLVAMGVFPGADVTLLRRFPSYVFEVGYSQFAVDEGIAATIYVCLRPSL
jgi:Fe2+ transport system protein FeoA